MPKISWSGSKMVRNKVVRDSVFHCMPFVLKYSIFLQHHRLRDNWPINQLMAVTQEPSVVARQLTPHIKGGD